MTAILPTLGRGVLVVAWARVPHVGYWYCSGGPRALSHYSTNNHSVPAQEKPMQ